MTIEGPTRGNSIVFGVCIETIKQIFVISILFSTLPDVFPIQNGDFVNFPKTAYAPGAGTEKAGDKGGGTEDWAVWKNSGRGDTV